ncbi:MAG TPA: glycerate kinase [Clostridia bacterium]|nr:glycerate kinase [Clostridia bacterium]
MKILVAPNAFKGSLSSGEAARAIVEGMCRVLPDATFISIGLSDGGDGLLDAVLMAVGGERVSAEVMGPLGEPVVAELGILDGGETAVIEMCRASGLNLLSPGRLNALKATTFGTGQLIKVALERGARKIILGIGGSATTDGGAGALQALGVKFLDQEGIVIPPGMGGGDLIRVCQVDTEDFDSRLRDVEILIACDVTNPLLGPEGAAAVYAPQKGASAEEVAFLEAGLTNYISLVEAKTGKSVRDVPGSGAAGGIGAGLCAFTKAALAQGFDLVCDLVGLTDLLRGVDLVVTGEGKTDAQTGFGKVPAGVLRMAHERGIPVLLISGSVDGDVEALGFDGVISCVSAPISTQEAMKHAAQLLTLAAERAAHLLKLGFRVLGDDSDHGR